MKRVKQVLKGPVRKQKAQTQVHTFREQTSFTAEL